MARRYASCAIAVAIVLSLHGLSAYRIEQSGQRHIREAALGQGSILDALLPDDDVVEISWPNEEIKAFNEAGTSIAELQAVARKGPFVAAIVTVTSVHGMLVQSNNWIHTKFVATVNDVLLTAPATADQNRIARGQAIAFRTRSGEVTIGGVTVRAGFQARYPTGRQYVVFLDQRQKDNSWTIHARAPLLIDGDRVRFPAIEPVSNRLSGVLLSDMTRALRSEARVALPRDQSDEDADFSAWIRRLRTAAETGDLKTLRDACAPTMSVEFEPVTAESVIGKLVPGRPWRELRDALRLGVVRSVGGFVAPYTFEDDHLDYGELAITGRAVNIRRTPAPDAPVVGVLSLDVVKEDDSHYFDSDLFRREDNPSGTNAWAKVTAPNGITGYVYGRYVRQPLAIRFIFERVNGEWKITAFAAGD